MKVVSHKPGPTEGTEYVDEKSYALPSVMQIGDTEFTRGKGDAALFVRFTACVSRFRTLSSLVSGISVQEILLGLLGAEGEDVRVRLTYAAERERRLVGRGGRLSTLRMRWQVAEKPFVTLRQAQGRTGVVLKSLNFFRSC